MQYAVGWIPLTAFALTFTRFTDLITTHLRFVVEPASYDHAAFMIVSVTEAILLTVLAGFVFAEQPSNNVAAPEATFLNENLVVTVYCVSIGLYALRVLRQFRPGPVDGALFGLYLTLAIRSSQPSARNISWALVIIATFRLAAYANVTLGTFQKFQDTVVHNVILPEIENARDNLDKAGIPTSM